MLYSIVRGSSKHCSKGARRLLRLLGFLGLQSFRMKEFVVFFLKVRDSTICIDGIQGGFHSALKFRMMFDGTGSHSSVETVESLFSNTVELIPQELDSAPETDDEDKSDNEKSRIEHGFSPMLLVSNTNLDEIQPDEQFVMNTKQRHYVLLLFFLHPLSNPLKF